MTTREELNKDAAREELRKIGQKQRARVSNLNSWSNNTQKLPNSFADSNRLALFKLFLPKSKRINLAFC